MRYFFCIVGSVIGVLVTLLLGIALYIGLREARSVTDEPLRMDMREAVERARSGRSAWVWLTDARADCARSVRFTDTGKEGDAQDAVSFVAVNEARDIEIVVDVRDLRDCRYVGNVHYIGMLKKIDDGQRQAFVARGLALPAAGGDAWWLCAGCRPGDEWPAVVALLLMGLLSGWVTLKVFRARTVQSVQKMPRRPKRKG